MSFPMVFLDVLITGCIFGAQANQVCPWDISWSLIFVSGHFLALKFYFWVIQHI